MELVSWDWGNTKILVEHCDAFTKVNTNPQKGFLSLSDEIIVMAEGKALIKGSPEEVRKNDKVLNSYLGYSEK